MLIVAYTLYKTPLDDEYKNVYDNYTSLSDYHTFLTTYAEHTEQRTVDYPNQRSVKSINGDIVLPIDGLRADEIITNGYNYVEVLYQKSSTSASQPVYYFIQKVESLNDHWKDADTGKNACKLFLKYDAWTNNYLDNIKNSNHVQKVNRMTLNHYYSMNGENPTVIVKSDIPTLEPTSRSTDFNNIVGEGLLCLGIRLAYEKVDITNYNDVNVKDSVMPSQRYAPVIYVPVKWFKKDDTYISLKDSSGQLLNIGGKNSIFTTQDYLNHVAVLDAWLTFYGTNVNETKNEDGTYSLQNSYIVKVDLKTTDTVDKTFYAVAAYSYSYAVSVDCDNYLALPSSSDYQKSGYDELKNYSENLNIYPFKSKALKIGSNIINLSINNTKSQIISISRNNSTIAYLNWERYTNENFRTPLNSMDFHIGKYVDSLDLFYMNNSNSLVTEQSRAISKLTFGIIKTGIGTGMMAATGGAFGIGSTIGGARDLTNSIIDLYAIQDRISDANNKLDSYSIPPQIGSDSYYYDGVFVTDMRINDEATIKSYFYECHTNGSFVCAYATVGNTEKDLFDCIKTVNCNLPTIPIIAHRKEIETACDRGIRKFHITATNKQAAFDCEAEYANFSV